jgi:hypothetical protein
MNPRFQCIGCLAALAACGPHAQPDPLEDESALEDDDLDEVPDGEPTDDPEDDPDGDDDFDPGDYPDCVPSDPSVGAAFRIAIDGAPVEIDLSKWDSEGTPAAIGLAPDPRTGLVFDGPCAVVDWDGETLALSCSDLSDFPHAFELTPTSSVPLALDFARDQVHLRYAFAYYND